MNRIGPKSELGGSVVHVIDDDSATCTSLTYLLQSAGFAATSYSDGRQFLESADLTGPCCALVDIRMPGMSGLALLEALEKRNVPIPIIVITGYADVPTTVQCFKYGAVDFLEKPFSDQALLDRVHESIRRDMERCSKAEQQREVVARFDRLTPRELEVLRMVSHGDSTIQAAQKLGLSHKTVEVHRANIMSKTKAGSLAELVRLAILAGLAD